MGNYYVDKILEETKITDYLAENGIHPVKQSGDKFLYRCPIHSGDNDPSFIVYPVGTKGRSYQTYHCFGCHSGINIINLKMDLEGITAKEAVGSFLKGINIDPVDAMDSIIDSNILDIKTSEINDEEEYEGGDKDIEFLMLTLNSMCRDYLNINAQGDADEIKFFDNKFYRKIDELAIGRDIDTLNEYYNMLLDKNVLTDRAESIQKRKEEEDDFATKWII